MSEKGIRLALGVIALLAISVLFIFTPGEGSIYPPCPTHYLTNLSCPGCGSLRAFHNLLHGNIKEAFFFNPLLVIVLPFLAVWFLLYIIKPFVRRKLPEITLKPVVFRLIFSAIILFVVLRNLPFYPFSLFKS